MKDDITYNYAFPKNARVRHRQIEAQGIITVSTVFTKEVLVRWDNGKTEKINVLDLEIIEE